MPATESCLLAAVVLAADALAEDTADIAAMVQAARATGADPVIVVRRHGMTAPAGARLATVAAGAKRITAIRSGMALLANTATHLVLLWPFGAEQELDASARLLPKLVEAAARRHAPVTAIAGADVDRTPIIVARDSWLELMTVGEQGMPALTARLGVELVVP